MRVESKGTCAWVVCAGLLVLLSACGGGGSRGPAEDVVEDTSDPDVADVDVSDPDADLREDVDIEDISDVADIADVDADTSDPDDGDVADADVEPPESLGRLDLQATGPRSFGGTFTSPRAGGGDVVLTFSLVEDEEGAGVVSWQGAGGDPLVVRYDASGAFVLELGGSTLTGMGAADPVALDALEALQGAALWDAIAGLPLELGCVDEDLSPAGVAALLFPLQLVLKYRVADRSAYMAGLAARASCAYMADLGDSRPGPTHVLLSRAAHVPVVMGYFPLDGEGAHPDALPHRLPFPLRLAPLPAEVGPCDALCRGACGADCTLANCTAREEWYCDEDAEEALTGDERRWEVFNCGIHAGCFWHDECYDTCNRGRCGSWGAAACRHNTVNGCDNLACFEFGYGNCTSWARGGGPFTGRVDYAYPVVPAETRASSECEDAENCPGVAGVVFPEVAGDRAQVVYTIEGVALRAPLDACEGLLCRREVQGAFCGQDTLVFTGSVVLPSAYPIQSLTLSLSSGEGEGSAFQQSHSFDANVEGREPPESLPFSMAVPVDPETRIAVFSVAWAGFGGELSSQEMQLIGVLAPFYAPQPEE